MHHGDAWTSSPLCGFDVVLQGGATLCSSVAVARALDAGQPKAHERADSACDAITVTPS